MRKIFQAHANYAAHYGHAIVFWRWGRLSVGKAGKPCRSRRQQTNWQAGFFISGRCRCRGSGRNAAAVEIQNDNHIERTKFKDSKFKDSQDRATAEIKDRTVHADDT